MRRCKLCDSILVPIPQIEKLIKQPLEICTKCLVDGLERLVGELE